MWLIVCTITLTWSFITGGGIDYGSGPYNVTFLAGETRTVVKVPLNNDYDFEGNENFMLTIKSSSLHSRVTPVDPSQAIVTIWDNDCKDSFLFYKGI